MKFNQLKSYISDKNYLIFPDDKFRIIEKDSTINVCGNNVILANCVFYNDDVKYKCFVMIYDTCLDNGVIIVDFIDKPFYEKKENIRYSKSFVLYVILFFDTYQEMLKTKLKHG